MPESITLSAQNPEGARKTRIRTIRLAWSSLFISKIVTFGVQVLAIPTAYRALGEDGFAAYAAVTASANLIWALNLGIGGALVTPIAEAAARGDETRQAQLVHAGLFPLVLVCLIGALLVVPILLSLPLATMFGRAGQTGLPGIRAAAVIAMAATLLTIPLSGIDALRQAYQEMHIGIMIGTVCNALMCVGLLLASRYSHSLTVFVLAFVGPPLLAKIVSCAALLAKRRYLLRGFDLQLVKVQMKPLLGDGIRYLGSSFSNILVYQWPVYWMTRHEATGLSSAFAICTQMALVPVSSLLGLVQPLWSPIADAVARKDYGWLDTQVRRTRNAIVASGLAIFATILIGGDLLVQLWIGKPLSLGWQVRGLVGLYVALALWEGSYLTICFGLGRLREGSTAVFLRVICFAIAVPLLTWIGGPRAIWLGLCCSVLFWTGWKLPLLGKIGLTVKLEGFQDRLG